MVQHKRTFGQNLSHFVRSVDIVDDFTKNDVLSLIESYLGDELDIRYFTFYVEGSIDLKVGLNSTDWYRGRGGDSDSFTIKDNEGNYQGQVPLAYDRDISLWIVSSDQGPLRTSDSYQDLLSNVESKSIPEYVKKTDYEIYTSIIRPIRDGSRIYGIVNFESSSYLEYSLAIEKELKRISRSISTLFLLNKAYKNQRQNTDKEISYLTELKNNKEDLLHLSKPKVFIASSSRADDIVMSVIREVLDEYGREIEVVYWRDIADSGTITHQILAAIRECQYGICYLSEPVEEDSTYAYKDNANVLIEAGMLSTMFRETDFDNWIPIREQASDKLPSDFANNRTLLVQRLANNTLNDERLKSDLRAALSSWPEFESNPKR